METTYILLGAVIAGVTELLNRLRGKDYWVVATIVSAATIGGVFGYFGVEGLGVVEGIAAGFGTSGTISALHALGSAKSPVTKSSVLEQ